MKIRIIGEGSFGGFLKEILATHFKICDDAESIILAVPISAYEELGKKFKDKHLINVCSVQLPSTNILLKYTDKVSSIHPLFGKRTPDNKRNSILTKTFAISDDLWFYDEREAIFLEQFKKVSNIITHNSSGVKFTPESHDILMAKTHLAAVISAQQAKVFIERAKDIPDEYIPNSFRLLREFVKTLEDMPEGTMESILANPY